MLKIIEKPYDYTLDYSLLNKPRSEVYGFICGLVQRMEVCQTLGITISEFLDFLIDVDRGYKDNPYHSFYHAVDVVMVLYHFLELYEMSEHLTRIEVTLLIIAALCHDIGHPGKNNQFEISCRSKLAQEFNNLSVLESNSCKLALELIDKHNLTRHIESKSKHYASPMTPFEFKRSMVKMILATDMMCHFALLDNISILQDIVRHMKQTTFKPLFSISSDPLSYFERWFKENLKGGVKPKVEAHGPDKVQHNLDKPTGLTQEERLMLCNILIHAADVSNPCRPWQVSRELSRLVCIEFSRQAEEERQRGFVSQIAAEPATMNTSFIDLIVYPYFQALSLLFPKSVELVSVCARNRDEWRKTRGRTIDLKMTVSATGTVPIQSQRILHRSVSFNPIFLHSVMKRNETYKWTRRKSEDVHVIKKQKIVDY
ncbi:hypothetical protein G6F57_007413 [Rhizopus arrhizus]|nr:hypothetical protein G6F24_007099 [Rhizopus arrhizus]KAG1418245.1 hypothetical protein G6F58_005138 [Rhizopus delemar]KAG0786836.1 hypothetical protein G6F21_008316 [Rhizopus arrhizus]KAG0813298.1 hypothetical protein G6F20_005676 [Rhizopus arrhizus]KAG0832314.1 hypothetical protein G6F18_007260 [Rhizopus arrhizus]